MDNSSKITFVTHLRYDSEDRLQNFQTILNYYSTICKQAHFVFVEDDKEHCTLFDSIKYPKNSSFYFIKNEGCYHRTRCLNYGMFNAKTKIAVSLDTDCLVSEASLFECVDSLLNNKASYAWPYNGFFIDVEKNSYSNISHKQNLYNFLQKQLPNVTELQLGTNHGPFSVRCTPTMHKGVGGIVMVNTKDFKQIGGYNEHFIGWGAEDSELNIRFEKLNYISFRSSKDLDVCFHLYHDKAIRHNNPFYTSNYKEAIKVENMSKEELINYITTWPWVKKL